MERDGGVMFGLMLVRTHKREVAKLEDALARAGLDVKELALSLDVVKGRTEPMLRRLAAYCAAPDKRGCPPIARARCVDPALASRDKCVECWLAWARADPRIAKATTEGASKA